MATTLAVTEAARKLGPVSLSTAEETVTVTFKNDQTAFTLIADGPWLFDTTAAQSNSIPFDAGQSVTIKSSSSESYTFYARTASGTAKLYLLSLG